MFHDPYVQKMAFFLKKIHKEGYMGFGEKAKKLKNERLDFRNWVVLKRKKSVWLFPGKFFLFFPFKMNLKELKDWARKAKVKGFSKMKKASLEKNWEERQPETSSTTKILALNSFPTKFVPNVVETSVDKAISWAERLKQVKDKLKEKNKGKTFEVECQNWRAPEKT